MFSLLRLYIVEEVVLNCYQHSCLWLCAMIRVLGDYGNPWIWRENQRGALIGFSYSEIRFLNKNIVKCPILNAIFRQSIYFFPFFFVLRHYR